MNSALIFGVFGALLVGIGLYGFLAAAEGARRILAFNIIGSGAFLVFGALAKRDPVAAADPTPHAMIITGVVVALSVTALALALQARLEGLEESSEPPRGPGD